MLKTSIIRLICFSLLLISQPVLAGDITEPEFFEVTDAWLTSDPQTGVDYHVLRVCQDKDMTIDCTQCIYRAKSDGSVWMPVNNRCVYRVRNDPVYFLFFQIKAATLDGLESKWTDPRPVIITRIFGNDSGLSYAGNMVTYDTQVDAPLDTQTLPQSE
ncbi:MAG: hypothetical protein R6V46_18210 [Desulfatiglandaceae bacterium]